MESYNTLISTVQACLKRIQANDRCYTELRTALNKAVSKRLISKLPELNLSRTVDRDTIVSIANGFVASKLVTKTTVKERGWTEGLIKKHLGDCDVLAKNPHYRSSAPMQLYSLPRVELAEQKAEVQAAFSKLEKHREARVSGAAKAVETKTQRLMDFVDGIVIHIPRMPVAQLMEEAVRHYNYLWSSRSNGDWKSASTRDNPEFLARIIGNYVRHELTNYENQLDGIAGKTGTGEAYDALKSKVMSEFHSAYPNIEGSILAAQSSWKLYEEHKRLAKEEEAIARNAEYQANPSLLFELCEEMIRMRKKLNGVNTQTGAVSKNSKGLRRCLIRDVNSKLSILGAGELSNQAVGLSRDFKEALTIELDAIKTLFFDVQEVA